MTNRPPALAHRPEPGRPPHTERSGARAGFTLVETLMALGMFSVLLLGIGAAMSISVRAVDDGSSSSARTAKAASAVAQMSVEISSATSFSARQAHAVEFAVPDRTGDSQPETIRYEWLGKPNDPITRAMNAGTPIPVVPSADSFDLTYSTHSTVTRSTNLSTSNNAITLSSFSSWSGVAGTNVDYRLSAAGWLGEYILIDPALMPTTGNTASITRVSVNLKGVLLTAGTVTLGIYKAVGGTGASRPRPATLIGTPATVNMPALALVGELIYKSTDFNFTDVVIGPNDSEIVLLFKGSGSGCADIRYLNSTSAPADGHEMEWTSNSGGGWQPGAAQINHTDLRYTVYANKSVTNSAEALGANYFLDSVGISILPGSHGESGIRTTALVFNSPQVPSP